MATQTVKFTIECEAEIMEVGENSFDFAHYSIDTGAKSIVLDQLPKALRDYFLECAKYAIDERNWG